MLDWPLPRMAHRHIIADILVLFILVDNEYDRVCSIITTAEMDHMSCMLYCGTLSSTMDRMSCMLYCGTLSSTMRVYIVVRKR